MSRLTPPYTLERFLGWIVITAVIVTGVMVSKYLGQS